MEIDREGVLHCSLNGEDDDLAGMMQKLKLMIFTRLAAT
jgi:hypothetical protein